jgi:hypothetical protein
MTVYTQCRCCSPYKLPAYLVVQSPAASGRWSAARSYKGPTWEICPKCGVLYPCYGDWCSCAGADRGRVDVAAERARFVAATGEPPERWLARWRAAQIERNGVNYTRAYTASLLTGEPANWGSARRSEAST